MKEAYPKAPVLKLPACDHVFYIKTDVSGVVLGAALTQEHGAEVCLPVAYVSWTLREAEKCGYVIEQEGIAAIWSVYCLSHI